MQLRYISVAALIAEAGGDPWAINKSLQAGRPWEISSLAEAFHRAGRCTSEAQHAFEQARNRFDAAWNRQGGGGNPINDSLDVLRVTQSLGDQSWQLPKIGVDLENIAASLAEAQKAAAGQIVTLENQLQTLDDLIGQAVAMEQSGNLSAEDKHTLDVLIHNCERDAIDDTKATLGQLNSIRNGYADGLRNSLGNLRTEGYDPARLHDFDADGSPKPTEAQLQALADLRRITDQAVVDQMGKVRAAQDALNKAMADLYTHGPGSPEGEAASAKLPKLKADLAHALDDLGKIPDYKDVDPASVTITPDGRFMFTHTVDGQPVQVYGQLKDGAGEFFDQAMGTSYSFSGGKLTGMRTLDPGKVEATPEPLWSAITLAVGGPELKAGGEVAWQGLKTLFSREALTGLTGDNVLARAMSGAEIRAAIAEAHLPPPGRPIPDISGEPVPGTTHPGPAPVVEHAPHPGGGGSELPPDAGPHVPVGPDGPPPSSLDTPPHLPSDHPLFDGYHAVQPGPEFTKPDGSLLYPDDGLATKPYAVPGTVIPNANLQPGTVLERFGNPGGSYLAPDGTPFAQLALPPESALKPYYQYVVKDPTALPPGYHIEQSQVAPWFHQPGGGIQYRVIGPDGKNAPVEVLEESGFLKDMREK
ncbi:MULTISPECIES: TNT domain-containing protein [unclassified Mycobacterium]|uniref:TNT domain-containing protein n=1 Tax=unclassified Mycobacterium TaxID=2642494 RepID=UPI0006DC32B5|nr:MULTISPECIES: TNT domain-containing protein [unclassified Mycobacterium]